MRGFVVERAGLEIHRYHSRLTAEGMTIVADVMGGDVPTLDGVRVYQMPHFI